MCSFIPPPPSCRPSWVTAGRPSAPFAYTNEWGNCLALLLPWLIARWWFKGTRRQRMIALAAVVLAIVPIIYSLDRGLGWGSSSSSGTSGSAWRPRAAWPYSAAWSRRSSWPPS
jgi:hypothetical protein